MLNRFRGDASDRVPAQSREAYRLWFSFLQLALRDARLTGKFDAQFYEPWGELASQKFKPWFDKNWRDLFAVPTGVTEIENEKHWRALLTNGDRIVIAVPRDQSLAETKRQIVALLKHKGAHKQARLKNSNLSVRYAPTSSNMRLGPLRMLERIYSFWLANNYDTDATAHAYLTWAQKQNGVADKRNKPLDEARRERRALKQFADTDQARGDYPAYKKKRWKRPDFKRRVREVGWLDEKNDQQQKEFLRYIRKARRIAENVLRGEFPGDYGS